MKILLKNIYRSYLKTKKKSINLLNNRNYISAEEFRLAYEKATRSYFEDTDKFIEFAKSHSLYDFLLYYVSSEDAPHYKMPWNGQEMTKLPADYWIYNDLIYKSEPTLIIEIGTQRGVSAMWFKYLSQTSLVVTIDIIPPNDLILQNYEQQGIIFIEANINQPDIIDVIEKNWSFTH